ncbi:glycosyl hydrolase family 28-related protein [Burkholderia cenocepacia]|uniref:glycosyl hydrolase family 28-related protein n=1 Tax=Burkholderia cenocepacia TaxID=95486 RepID=UPI00264BE5B6|nr:glycosyl hydrolase family 28-related protein [Burkholderia cenocepacia]MDN7454847.1 glycosyl hydrolase family 28-related protein [Burkholderia cenocepacia]
MTVTTDVQSIVYDTDGSTTDFPIPFYFLRSSDITAELVDANDNLTELVLGTDFTVTGAGQPSGGELRATHAFASGYKLHVYRVVPVTQESQYQQNDPFPAKTTEKALDKLTMLIQQQKQTTDRALVVPRSDLNPNTTLPSARLRANKALGFDNRGDPFAIDLTIGSVLTPVVHSVAMLRLVLKFLTTDVFVVGYRTPGDGGGGAYFLDPTDHSSDDNGGTVIVAVDGGRWKLRLTGPVSIKQFGAYGDKVHDDFPFIQAAIDSGVRSIYMPPGDYVLSQQLQIRNNIHLFGEGYPQTILWPDDSISGMKVTTPNPVLLEKFGLLYTTRQADTLSAVDVNPDVGQNGASTMRDVFIARCNIGLNLQKSALFSTERCFFQDVSWAGIVVSNSAYADNGDSVIENCTFFNYSDFPNSRAIEWHSSGGLRVLNNKFGAYHYGVKVEYDSFLDPATAQLLIEGNSFDGMRRAAVSMNRNGAHNSFNSIIIKGNVCPECAAVLSIPTDPSGPWINSLVLEGNTWISPQTGTPVFASISPVSNFNIGSNTLFGNAPSSVGFSIGGQAQAGIIQGNNLSGAFATTLYIDPAAIAIRAVDNQGIDPRGPLSPTVGASPWTYAAGPFHTTLYISSDSSIVAVTQGGGNILPKPTGANQTFTLVLDPLEAAIITYTGTLTACGMSH